jgi:DNA modification methylase
MSNKMSNKIKCLDSAISDRWAMYNGDCVEVVAQMPDRSVDCTIYSPPFSDLFVYSDSERDMGNCASDDEFVEHYAHLLRELFRVTRPGRMSCVHVSDLPARKSREGFIGLRDFSGDVIRAHTAAGFHYHSRITIWKDPVTEMQRTKAHGLLYKNIRTDSTRNRVGMPDYILIFKRPPMTKAEEDAVVPVTHTPKDFPLDDWQEIASPVWMTIDQGNTLNARIAREASDEKHMCPLQLDVIERLCRLYTNHGETVLSPFGGVASEGVGVLRHGRRFVGVELKESYYRLAVKHLREETSTAQQSMFG